MVGPVIPEKRLLWHPREENKFVVGGGSQITLYEWAPEQQEIRHVTSQHDLQFMKTFAWSPDPAFEDLMAVGLSTGRVDLLRLEATRHTRRTSAGTSVLSSGPIVSLLPRNSRAVNALDFCTVDPNFIAVGLDKVRGDSSLVVYDVSSARAKLSLSAAAPDADNVAPLPRAQPHIPRVELGPRADPRTVQHHAPTEIVSSVAYVSGSNHLLLAGMSFRWFRLLDIRTPSPAVTNVAAKVQSIITDPYDPHRIGTFGDGFISIWDARKIAPAPLLSFTEKDAAADGALSRLSSVYAGIEFSSTRRGTLAALHRDASYVRFWDMLGANRAPEGGSTSSDGDAGESSSMSSRLTRKSWTAGLPWTAGPTSSLSLYQGASQTSKDLESSSLVLCDTRRTRLFPKTLSSFALVPSPTSKSRLPLASNVMVVNKDGDLELYSLSDTPKQAIWSGRGDLAISAGQSCRVYPGITDDEEMEQEFIEQQRERESSLEQLRYVQQQATMQAERARSVATVDSRSGDMPQLRERGRTTLQPLETSPALFGRGDEDGFPALSSSPPAVARTAHARNASQVSAVRAAAPTGISATRPGSVSKSRTWSPASMRRYPYESSGQSRSQSRTGQQQEASTTRAERLPEEVVPVSTASAIHSRGRPKKPNRGAHSRSLSKGRGVEHIVEDDISMVIRRRCLKGYSIGNPYHNTAVTKDDDAPVPQMLSDLWFWINNAQDFLCVPTPRLHGYDFSHQGIMGIWEGLVPVTKGEPPLLPDPVAFPPVHKDLLDARSRSRSRRSHSPADDLHGNFQAALAVLALRSGDKSSASRFPAVSSAKPLQRQVALQLCGWSLREDELMNNIKRWEIEGNQSRAACWLVFTQQYGKAVEVLMRSDDESHHMMSGTLAALLPSSARSHELREHCERLIIRLQDPYFRAMLTHLTLGDWSEVLDEEVIPFRERLAIAFQFLDDKNLSSYLHRSVDNSCHRGEIDGLIVTGLTKRGFDILQSYVDRTGDVQTAAILASYACPAKFSDSRAEHWVEAYRDLLDGFKLHHHRVSFDIERGGLLQDAIQNGDAAPVEWAPRQILIRCNYCNKSVTVNNQSTVIPKNRPTTCANCSRALPRCSVCLMTLSIVPDVVRDAELAYSPSKDTIDDAIVICQTCRHGGHASHILEWFFGEDGVRSHGLCAVANCDCRCTDEF